MRVSRPSRAKCACTAAMSITARRRFSALPGRSPATRSARGWAARVQLETVADLHAEGGLRRRAEKDGVLGKRGKALGAVRGAGSSAGRGSSAGVTRARAKTSTPMICSASVLPMTSVTTSTQRARLGHLGTGGEQRVKSLVESAARPQDLQVRLACHGAQPAAEFRERRLVHGLHCHAQRHPEHDGRKRKQRRHPPPGERAEKDRRQPHPSSPSAV